MKPKAKNIFWQTTKINKSDRQRLHQHKSCVLWFTGLSGAGKSTLTLEVEKELFNRKISCYILDGDNLRHGLNKNLDFSPTNRSENIRRLGEVAKLFVDAGIISLVAAISPYRDDRNMVRNLLEDTEFIEIYVKCSVEECERRDPKGLYKKARLGEIINFTGISAPYEAPLKPEMIIESDTQSLEVSVEKIISYLQENGYMSV